ncbi:hypothetical protein BC835DRAFT_997683 [Cytidiella melzeri]|nr:hypothetical protein BC835DRAFT_997683 [Cytidiella melzeri]
MRISTPLVLFTAAVTSAYHMGIVSAIPTLPLVPRMSPSGFDPAQYRIPSGASVSDWVEGQRAQAAAGHEPQAEQALSASASGSASDKAPQREGTPPKDPDPFAELEDTDPIYAETLKEVHDAAGRS